MNQVAIRNLRLIKILTFLYAFKTIDPVLAIYFSLITGSFAAAMLIMATINLSAAVFEIPTGVFSDRIGRKKTLVLHYSAGLLGVVLYFVSHSTGALLLGAMLIGLSMALRSGTVEAYVYENLALQHREADFEKIEGERRSMEYISLVFASLLGALLIAWFDMRQALLATLGFRLAAVLLAFRLTNITSHRELTGNIYTQLREAWQVFKGNERLKNLGIARIIKTGGGNVEYRLRALYFQTLMPTHLINILGMLMNLTSSVMMRKTHVVVKRFGYSNILVWGETTNRVIIMLLVWVNQAFVPWLMGLVGSSIYGLKEVATEHLLQKEYGPKQRATMGSIVGLGSTLLYGVIGIGIGAAADLWGVRVVLLSLQPFLMLSVLFYHQALKETRIGSKQASAPVGTIAG
jgi:MFS family permease